MKKTTAFFLTIAVLAMIAGGVGTIFYYQLIQREHKTEEQKYKIKQPDKATEMTLTLNGDSSYIINSHDSEQITLQTNRTSSTETTGDFSVKEESNHVNVTVNTVFKEKNKLFTLVDLGSFTSYYESSVITIPSSIKKLTILGKSSANISLHSLSLDTLKTDLASATINSNGLYVKDMAFTSRNGSLFFGDDSTAKKATLTTANGNISVTNAIFDELSTKSTSGDLSINQGRGNLTASTDSGDISVVGLRGSGKFTSKNGDFSLSTPDVPKQLDVNLEQGDISIYFNEIVQNISVKAEASMGDTTLLGKQRSTYKKGTDATQFQLKTQYGDISLDGPYSDD